jgi:hypothetical protein
MSHLKPSAGSTSLLVVETKMNLLFDTSGIVLLSQNMDWS